MNKKIALLKTAALTRSSSEKFKERAIKRYNLAKKIYDSKKPIGKTNNNEIIIPEHLILNAKKDARIALTKGLNNLKRINPFYGFGDKGKRDLEIILGKELPDNIYLK